MSSAGSRTPSAGLRNRTPSSQLGRTGTQGDSMNNLTGEDASIGAKSQNNSTRRFSAKPATAVRKSNAASVGSISRLETQYTVKKKRYDTLRKELMDKQKTAHELYNDISQLREKVIAGGAKDPGKLEEFNFEGGITKQASPLIAEDSVEEKIDPLTDDPAIPSNFVETLERQLHEIPKKSQDLCEEMLEKYATFASLAQSWLERTKSESNEVSPDVATRLESELMDRETLKKRLEEIKIAEAELTAELAKNAHGLYEEYENYRARWRELTGKENRKEVQARLAAVAEDLRNEREKGNQTKERLRQAEGQLQKARGKIRELEMRVANDEAKIQQLQGNIKHLEAQIKQKDLSMEQRIKDMQRTMKNSEGLVTKVEKQRDSFESRLMELKEKLTTKDAEAANANAELTEKLAAVTAEVVAEREKRQEVEYAFAELTERYTTLEEKSKQLCELAEKNKDFTITEGSHTEHEAQLFSELQGTRAELEEEKQKVMQLQREKEEIIAVMHQAACEDEGDDTREKLAAEVIFKSKQLQSLMTEYSEVKEVAKNAQERSGILEKQLIDIQTRLHTQSKEGGKAALSAHAIELQQQVSDLRNNLAELARQKEELETALTQKQLEVEQRDRVMREQSKFLKVRDELLGIMKGRNQDENGDLSTGDETNEYVEQINEQIAAKTEAIQDLYSTLESKQLQIMRLEKMVKLMEDQQDRAQAQRTRLENRIAQLELTLQKNKDHRGKAFGIL